MFDLYSNWSRTGRHRVSSAAIRLRYILYGLFAVKPISPPFCYRAYIAEGSTTEMPFSERSATVFSMFLSATRKTT